MYVVGHAADGEGQHVVVLANARHVRPEPLLHFVGNEPFAVLGAKDQMDVVLCVAVGQRCRPSGGSRKFISPLTQGLRTWARLFRPFGAGAFTTIGVFATLSGASG